MKKKIKNPKIEELALEMLSKVTGSMTITEITQKLKENHNIKLSPQVIKRHLDSLVKDGKLERV